MKKTSGCAYIVAQAEKIVKLKFKNILTKSKEYNIIICRGNPQKKKGANTMARKLLREQQSEAREIVKQIFNLALAFNPNDTTQDKTGEKPTVFVNFSGHVAGIDVRIYPTGWSSSRDVDSEMITYTIWLSDEQFTVLTDDYEPYPEEKECEQLSKAKAALCELQKIADKWGVDYV